MSDNPSAQIKAHALGGQAVMEGVMMRSPGWWALAVRRPDGLIHTESHEAGTYMRRHAFYARPLVRGVLGLGETMGIGVKALSISASVSAGDDDAPTAREIGIAITVAFVFFVALFIALPAFVDRGGAATGTSAVLHNLREGGIRLALFLLYILAISRMGDIKRVFEYHGAEHKVIAAYENGSPRTVDGAKPYSTVHVRCGTDFLFLVMLLSVVIFSFVPRYGVLFRIGSRIVLLPVVAAVSYETLRIAARFERNPLIRALTWPGRFLQKITTREPSDDQIEVALASLNELLRRETGVEAPPTSPPASPPASPL